MSANIIGALFGAAWLGAGTVALWFILFRTQLLEGFRGNFGLTANDLRRRFGLIVAFALCGGSIFGWFGGPILFGELL